jgi:C-terminal processing protease CtpA/Prc
MSTTDTKTTLHRWRTARRAVLGSIILAGSVVTSAAVMYRMAARDCGSYQAADKAYTYSGIGVVIEREHGQVIVQRTFRNAPAFGLLHRGSRLVSVDGESPESLQEWQSAIRGAPGTTVAIEIESPCGGHRVVEIERSVIRLRY